MSDYTAVIFASLHSIMSGNTVNRPNPQEDILSFVNWLNGTLASFPGSPLCDDEKRKGRAWYPFTHDAMEQISLIHMYINYANFDITRVQTASSRVQLLCTFWCMKPRVTSPGLLKQKE